MVFPWLQHDRFDYYRHWLFVAPDGPPRDVDYSPKGTAVPASPQGGVSVITVTFDRLVVLGDAGKKFWVTGFLHLYPGTSEQARAARTD